MSEFETARMKVIALLKLYGIDPTRVRVDVTTEGYEEFQLTAEGSRLIDHASGLIVTEHRTWPEGFPVDELFAHVHTMQKAEK